MTSPSNTILIRAKFTCFCLALLGAALSISAISIAIGVYALLLAVSWSNESRKELPRLNQSVILLLFVLSAAASTAMTQYPRESIMGLVKYSQGFLLLYAGADAIRCRRDLWRAVGVLMAAQLLCAVSGIGQDWLGRDFILGRAPILFTAEKTRITGPFKHANDFATFLLAAPVIILSLLSGTLAAGKRLRSACLAIFMAVVVWALFRTMSRSAFLGVVSACTAVLLLNRSWKGLLLMAGLGAGVLAIPSSFQYRLMQLAGGQGTDFGERLFLIRASVRMIADRPWFGLGPNTYSRWFSFYNPPDPAAPVQMYSHNSFLQIGTEIGLVGLTLYIIFVGSTLFVLRPRIMAVKSKTADDLLRVGLWCSVIGLIVNALFESLLQSTQLRTLFWSLAGMAVAASALDARTHSRVILSHDWLNGMRGGEKCVESLLRLFPDAQIRTLLAEPSKLSEMISRRPIRTSFIQRLPQGVERYKWFLPLFPLAIRTLSPRPGECDLIISTSHCVAKGIRAPKGIPHICYCFTPMRYAWLFFDEYFGRLPAWIKPPVKLILSALRRWDQASSSGVTHFIAISEHVKKRIKKFYGRDAVVIYPPADLDYYTPPAEGEPREDFYLLVSALVPYKRPDLAVLACNHLKKRLVIIGTGPEMESLRKIAGPTVSFAGWASSEQIRDHYRRCKALIFPGEEDYGIVPVEAQGCGAPVIAYGVGGALETVRDGVTGLFFKDQTLDSLESAIAKAAGIPWDSAAIRTHAEKYSEPRFRDAMSRFVGEHCPGIDMSGEERRP